MMPMNDPKNDWHPGAWFMIIGLQSDGICMLQITLVHLQLVVHPGEMA